jgi:Hemerythrin HHE cation binding domain
MANCMGKGNDMFDQTQSQTQTQIRTDGMATELQSLLRDYPRDSWDAHPGFAEKTRNWLGAHQMFRQLAQITGKETELFVDRARSGEDFAARLSHYGGLLVGNLRGYHGWEDRSYFPELSAADPRFDAGLEILEKDHQDLDKVLDSFTKSANRVIKLVQLDADQARDEAGRLHGVTQTIQAFLTRHLTDEEDLAVPIILHHRLRG